MNKLLLKTLDAFAAFGVAMISPTDSARALDRANYSSSGQIHRPPR